MFTLFTRKTQIFVIPFHTHKKWVKLLHYNFLNKRSSSILPQAITLWFLLPRPDPHLHSILLTGCQWFSRTLTLPELSLTLTGPQSALDDSHQLSVVLSSFQWIF